MSKRATGFAQRVEVEFTARSPRPIIILPRSFSAKVTESVGKIQRYRLWSSGHDPQLLPWRRGARLQRVVRVFGAEHHVDRLAQKLAPAACGVEAAGDLAGFEQVAAIVGIGAAVGAFGQLEEIAQRLGGDELGLGIDRVAECLE